LPIMASFFMIPLYIGVSVIIAKEEPERADFENSAEKNRQIS